MATERRGDYDGALALYVKAAGAHLSAGNRTAAERAIIRAEKIKQARADVALVVRNRFSIGES
jgi:hypothetical protein